MELDLLINIASSHLESFIEPQHIKAAASHYIQNPDTSPPFITPIIKELLDTHIKQYIDSINWNNIPYPPPEQPKFTFIDLFAGIGGFRQAMQNLGGKCVFSSDSDKFARDTYYHNYGEYPYGDIRSIPKNLIPEHDILCAGFPCQPFSLAGVSKRNSLGRKHGFEDKTKGTLFFDIKEIIRLKRPKAFFLENVKNLQHHDKGRTFKIIKETLEDLGYIINWQIVDAAKWLPQRRKRIFIIGFDSNIFNLSKDDIIIPTAPSKDYIYPTLDTIINPTINSDKYTLSQKAWNNLIRRKQYHQSKGHGFGYTLIPVPIQSDMITPTIPARYYKDGSDILIEQPGKPPRKLTVEEAMQLQGFDPHKFTFPVSNSQAYKQIGNSVAIPAIQAAAKMITDLLLKTK